jgi:hypothetical protein
MLRAPLVVKVPVTLGKFEKSYVAVMVTGTGVGVEADAEGAEPIVKRAIVHSAIAAEKTLLCRIISILFFVNCWFEVMFTFPLQRDSGGRAARNRNFVATCSFHAILIQRSRENSG